MLGEGSGKQGLIARHLARFGDGENFSWPRLVLPEHIHPYDRQTVIDCVSGAVSSPFHECLCLRRPSCHDDDRAGPRGGKYGRIDVGFAIFNCDVNAKRLQLRGDVTSAAFSDHDDLRRELSDPTKSELSDLPRIKQDNLDSIRDSHGNSLNPSSSAAASLIT